MKSVSILVLFLIPLMLKAQLITASEKGIHWTEAMNWQQVKQKAREENKYIFVDAFATWCGPCKAMDMNVYRNEKVGGVIDSNFISIKVQMDSTGKDNQNVRNWYNDARMLMNDFRVTAFPTFLFFTPDGRIIHKSDGYKDTTAFIELARFVTDPRRLDFYTDLEAYRKGKRDYAIMPGLAKTMIELLNDKAGANEIAKDYKVNYLDKLPDEQLLTRQNLEFIYPQHLNLIASTNDRFFKLFFSKPDIVDSLLHIKGAAIYFVKFRIAKDEIWNKLFPNDSSRTPIIRKPDWSQIHSTISKKFGDSLADEIVPENRMRFYRRINDWRTWANLQDEKMKRTPPKAPKPGDYFVTSDTWILNGIAWDAFLHCNDKSVLQRALKWSDLSIKLEQPNPNIQYLDTRANLLYKLGRVKEAIAQETEAVVIDKATAKKEGREKGGFEDEYSATIEKMKKNEPTWPVK